MVPIATERARCPRRFSLVNMVAQILWGSKHGYRWRPGASEVSLHDARYEPLAHHDALATLVAPVDKLAQG